MAQLGNQNAKGSTTNGRKRTRIPETNEEIIALGEDLILWASSTEGELKCRFAQWYTTKNILRANWKKLIEHIVFRPYYEEARSILCSRFVDGSVNPSISQRYLRIYDEDVKEEENETLRLKADLNKAIPQEPFDNVIRSIAQAIKGS